MVANLQAGDDTSTAARRFMDGYERHKDVRRPIEAEWTTLGRYYDPRRSMTFGAAIKDTLGQRQANRIYTSAGIMNKDICAATLASWLVNPTKPFLSPNVERDMMARGQSLDLGAEDREYLTSIKWQAFYGQMRPRSGFITSLSTALNDWTGYGLGVTYQDNGPGGATRWRHRDFRRCYIAVNAAGDVDTLWYEDFLPAWRVRQLWPSAEGCPEFVRRYPEGKGGERELVTLIYACEPREGVDIRIGGPKLQKPFKFMVVMPDFKAFVLEESGYDGFPYQVARHRPRDGSPYPSGSLALNALPDVMVLDHYQRGLEVNLDLMNDPVTAVPSGLFDSLSWVPGTVNEFDLNKLGFSNLRDSVQQLSLAGNVPPVVAYMQVLEDRIKRHFYLHLMELRTNGNMTATEVSARTDLWLRALADLVPGLDRDLLGAGADRQLQLMLTARQIPTPPDSLIGATVEWDYEGPLAAAMKANQVDGLGKLLGMWQMVHTQSPEDADAIDVEAIIRNWSDAQGIEPENLRSQEVVDKLRQSRAEQQRAMQQMEQLQKAAAAVRDGAQGMASMQTAGGTPPQLKLAA